MQVFVIPAYNEEENLPRLLHDLEERPMLWSGGHVILVDDGSSDGTVAVAQAHDGPVPLILVRQIRNQGAGRALTRGFRFALELCDDDDQIVTLESDTTSDLDALEGDARLRPAVGRTSSWPRCTPPVARWSARASSASRSRAPPRPRSA